MFLSITLYYINIIPILYFRWTYFSAEPQPNAIVLSAFLADLLFVAILTLFLSSVKKFQRTVRIVVTLLWWGYCAVLIEYFRAMNEIMQLWQFVYAIDIDFVATTISPLSILILSCCVIILSLIVAKIKRLRTIPRKFGYLVILLFLASLTFTRFGWQTNLLFSQIIDSYKLSQSRESLTSDDAGGFHFFPPPKLDLSGKSLIAERKDPDKPNILLVVMEGLSGEYLGQNLEHLGFSSNFTMPKLSKWAARGLVVPNTFAHTGQTINGIYSMLCSEYPLHFGTVTMDFLASEKTNDIKYLPKILTDEGYHNVFLQAADLKFMSKDQVMKRIGFNEVLGKEWYAKQKYQSNGWGVNDKDFFDGAMKKIQSLNKKNQPWFMTLLTVGTHHPYHNLPTNYRKNDELSPKQRAVSYLDDAPTSAQHK